MKIKSRILSGALMLFSANLIVKLAAAVYSGALTVTGYTKTIFDGIRMKNKEKDHKNDRIREKREVQL